MRIRFLNTFEPVNTFYRDLFPSLADDGMEVEAWVSRAEYRQGRRPLRRAFRDTRIRIREIPAGPVRPAGLAGKLWTHCTYIAGVVSATLFGPRTDLNVFLTQPPLFHLWGLVLRRLRRQRYAVVVMDLYPDLAVRAGVLGEGAPWTRLLSCLAYFATRRADAVFVIGRCMRDYLIARGVSEGRIHVVANWANESEIAPMSARENPLRRELGLENKFVVLYSGNMGVCHTFDEVLEVARRLRSMPEIRFVFVGHGSRRREVESAILTDALGNVTLLPIQPSNRLNQGLNLGEVHLVTLRPGFEGLVVPSKTYGALAAGRPVIYVGGASGEIARLVEEEGVGVVVRPGDADALERAIRGLFDHRASLERQGLRARTLTSGRTGRDRAVSEYARLLRKVSDGSQDEGKPWSRIAT